jgi:RNA polymerase sigma-70 factor (ECF subfamily)
LHYGELCAFACRYVGSLAVAEEIVQDLFLRLLTDADDGRPIERLTRPYLYGATRFAALHYLRRQRLESAWTDEAARSRGALPRDGEEVELNDLAAATERAVDALPERTRAVYTLRRHAGLGYHEIATVLGVSQNTVKTLMGRAIQSLRVALGPFLVVAITLAGRHH